MTERIVELGLPYTGWPVRLEGDYGFGLDILPAELIDRITAWARDFDHHFDEEAGWSSRDTRLRHLAEGRHLQSALREQLGDAYQVRLDPMRSGLDPLVPE